MDVPCLFTSTVNEVSDCETDCLYQGAINSAHGYYSNGGRDSNHLQLDESQKRREERSERERKRGRDREMIYRVEDSFDGSV